MFCEIISMPVTVLPPPMRVSPAQIIAKPFGNFTSAFQILFPMALFSIAMILRSGRSLEEGFRFVARKSFGRVSVIFGKVLELLPDYQLERCLAGVRRASGNRYYRHP